MAFFGGVADDFAKLGGPEVVAWIGFGRGRESWVIEVHGGICCEGNPEKETAHAVYKPGMC